MIVRWRAVAGFLLMAAGAVALGAQTVSGRGIIDGLTILAFFATGVGAVVFIFHRRSRSE